MNNYIYNQYLRCSNGIHPTPEQYNIFVYNYYYIYQRQQIPQINPDTNLNTNSDPCIVEIKDPLKDNRKNCELNMNCKDIYCLNFHHPRFFSKII